MEVAPVVRHRRRAGEPAMSQKTTPALEDGGSDEAVQQSEYDLSEGEELERSAKHLQDAEGDRVAAELHEQVTTVLEASRDVEEALQEDDVELTSDDVTDLWVAAGAITMISNDVLVHRIDNPKHEEER